MTSDFASCSAPIIRLPISTIGEDEAVLMEDWHIEWVGPLWEGVTVPAGTTTDGASIPRFLWRVCGHPLEAPRVYAATLHDWLYGGGMRAAGVTREQADRCYYALLRHFGISAWRSKIEYCALRLFGGSHWKESGETGAGQAGPKQERIQ